MLARGIAGARNVPWWHGLLATGIGRQPFGARIRYNISRRANEGRYLHPRRDAWVVIRPLAAAAGTVRRPRDRGTRMNHRVFLSSTFTDLANYRSEEHTSELQSLR